MKFPKTEIILVNGKTTNSRIPTASIGAFQKVRARVDTECIKGRLGVECEGESPMRN